MSAHRPDLHRYLRGLTQDLISRGVLRKAAGQSIDQLIAAEAATLLRELTADFFAIVADAKSGLAQALGGAAGSFLGGVLGALSPTAPPPRKK